METIGYRGPIIADDAAATDLDSVSVCEEIFSSPAYQRAIRNREVTSLRTPRDSIVWFEDHPVASREKGKVDVGVEYGQHPVYVLAHIDEDAMKEVLREAFLPRR